MRKVLSVFMSIILIFLFSGIADAENLQQVTIGQSSVSLGMSKDEVSRLVGTLYQVKDNNDWNNRVWHLNNTAGDYDDDATNEVPGDVLWVFSPFAGDSQTMMCYFFDKDEKLSSLLVFFDTNNLSFAPVDYKEATTEFNSLKSALSKYGQPISNGSHEVFNHNSYDVYAALNERFFTKRNTGLSWKEEYKTELCNSTQYLVNQGETYVVIDLVEYHRHGVYTERKEKKTRDYYGVMLSYSLCSKEQVESYYQTQEKENEALINDV